MHWLLNALATGAVIGIAALLLAGRLVKRRRLSQMEKLRLIARVWRGEAAQARIKRTEKRILDCWEFIDSTAKDAHAALKAGDLEYAEELVAVAGKVYDWVYRLQTESVPDANRLTKVLLLSMSLNRADLAYEALRRQKLQFLSGDHKTNK